jgi:hypothetical protein
MEFLRSRETCLNIVIFYTLVIQKDLDIDERAPVATGLRN